MLGAQWNFLGEHPPIEITSAGCCHWEDVSLGKNLRMPDVTDSPPCNILGEMPPDTANLSLKLPTPAPDVVIGQKYASVQHQSVAKGKLSANVMADTVSCSSPLHAILSHQFSHNC